MRFLFALLLTAIVITLGAVAFAYSGLYDVAATSPHSAPVAWLFSTTSDASIERRARAIEPPDLSGETRLLAGASDYDSMCAGCHGAPGREPGPIGRGLTPTPPDLAHAAEEMSPSELFWATRNGIRMTGMPAWGVTHDDNDLWSVIAFVEALPGIDADRYRSLLAEAKARHVGHHGGDTAMEQHDHDDDAGHHH